MTDLNATAEERYTPGYGDDLVRSYEARTVGREAAFFAPRLRPGMSLLDVGCGPGTITVGLARLVAPGRVCGIDIEESQVDRARRRAQSLSVTNVSFARHSAYEIPFPDGSFDAVFAHALLQHLRDPLAALREFHRLLKPGGVIGVRDDDQGSLLIAPASPQMVRVIAVLKTGLQRHGFDPDVGRRHRQLLRAGGFLTTEASASVEYDGTAETTRKRGQLAAKLLKDMASLIVAGGTATHDEVAQLAVSAEQWGADPDAFDAITWCEATGVKEHAR